jgi:AhpD family alkylhydroperoxidase
MKTRNAVAFAVVLLVAGVVAAGDAPRFMKDTYPQQGLEAAVADMMVLQAEDAALSGKVRELIGLAVAAQIPCTYCIYYHTKAAKKFGATEAEVREAIAAAAQVRKWSTMLNGSAYDEEAFQKEVDATFAGE